MKKTMVIIVMGSQSDFPVMKLASEELKGFSIPHEVLVVSAHRTPTLLKKSVKDWEGRGIRVIIAGAGGAAHLPGMLASFSVLPVIGVPVNTKVLGGLDSLLSIVQMPKGVPVATVGIDNAANAGILAAKIIAAGDPSLSKNLGKIVKNHKDKMYSDVMKMQKNITKLSKKKS